MRTLKLLQQIALLLLFLALLTACNNSSGGDLNEEEEIAEEQELEEPFEPCFQLIEEDLCLIGASEYAVSERPFFTDLPQFAPFLETVVESSAEVIVVDNLIFVRDSNGNSFPASIEILPDDSFFLEYAGVLTSQDGISAFLNIEATSPPSSLEQFIGTSTLAPDFNGDGVFEDGVVQSEILITLVDGDLRIFSDQP